VKGKDQLEDTCSVWKVNIKMDLKEIKTLMCGLDLFGGRLL
jgi:hypothetical protein